jgi:hypothetical protein
MVHWSSWSKEEGQRDKQRSTQKTKDQAAQIPLKIRDELWFSGKVSSSSSI